jgi:protein-S-isoprenylcysteine O-methyltransferase Ste14
MNWLQFTVASLALVCFVSFAAGAFTVFDRVGDPGPGLLAITIGAAISAVMETIELLASVPHPTWRWIVGGAGFVGSLALFARCIAVNHARPLTLAFANDLPTHLVKKGPYRIVRHPFYCSYMTAYLSGWIATMNLLLLPVIIGMGALYTRAARKEEAKFSASPLSHPYTLYQKRTGMFTPRLVGRQRHHRCGSHSAGLPLSHVTDNEAP